MRVCAEQEFFEDCMHADLMMVLFAQVFEMVAGWNTRVIRHTLARETLWFRLMWIETRQGTAEPGTTCERQVRVSGHL